MTKQIMITLQQIKDNDPCTDGWKKVLMANGGTKADMQKEFPVSSILESNDLDDTLWVLRCLPQHDYLWRKFAWWCASQNVTEETDTIITDCLDVVWRHSDGESTNDDLAAARAAARAAAWDAAWDAAWAAAKAAARAAAWAAAKAAARAAARDAQKHKLKQILDTGEFTK